jgi:hypothetical protein
LPFWPFLIGRVHEFALAPGPGVLGQHGVDAGEIDQDPADREDFSLAVGEREIADVLQRGADLPLERLIVRTLLGPNQTGDQQNQGEKLKNGSHDGGEGGKNCRRLEAEK